MRNMGAAISWQICHLVQENDVEREFQIHRTEHDYSLAEFWKWTLALLIGVIMGILGFLVDWGIEKLNNFKFDSTISSIRNGGEAIVAVCLRRSTVALLLQGHLQLLKHACTFVSIALDCIAGFLCQKAATLALQAASGLPMQHLCSSAFCMHLWQARLSPLWSPWQLVAALQKLRPISMASTSRVCSQ